MFEPVTPQLGEWDAEMAYGELRRIEALQEEYARKYKRSAMDDLHLIYAVGSVIEGCDRVQMDPNFQSLDLDLLSRQSFLTLLQKGVRVSHLGEDDHWQEANYYQHLADTQDALESAGIVLDVIEEDEA